jgi:hypothetical protein
MYFFSREYEKEDKLLKNFDPFGPFLLLLFFPTLLDLRGLIFSQLETLKASPTYRVSQLNSGIFCRMWPQGGWYWETEPPVRRSEGGRATESREAHRTTPGLCPGKTSKTTPYAEWSILKSKKYPGMMVPKVGKKFLFQVSQKVTFVEII